MNQFSLRISPLGAQESPAYSPTSLTPLSAPNNDYGTPIPNVQDDEQDTLPYPAPLARSAFLQPDFTPLTYLSTLRNRHQTLEDLRADLRARVHDLARDLTDLVNAEYETFLSVGDTLQGGRDRVQEVQIGVLGFRNQVLSVAEAVRVRDAELADLIDQRTKLRAQMAFGKRLLDLEGRVEELETRLAGSGESSDDDDQNSDDTEGKEMLLPRLRAHAVSLLQISRCVDRIGSHPFVTRLEPRIAELRRILLLDLAAGMRTAQGRDSSGRPPALLKIMALYRQLGESQQAVRVLQAT